MSAVQAVTLTPAEIARLYREQVVRDKSYQLLPLGMDAAAYLRAKRKQLTATSYRDYESCLDKLARFFPDLELRDFEPPVGTERIEEFLDDRWGRSEPRTYNKNLSILRSFFRWNAKRGAIQGDPTLAIERAKARGVYRTTFTSDQMRAIIASQPEVRDRIALRLLLTYGLRKGALKAVQFKHFDHVRRWLAIFTKAGSVRNVPIPDPAFWHDLERLILDTRAEAHHFLLPTSRGNQSVRRFIHEKPIGDHGLHDWWYRCLARAGVVAEGTTSGERMHKARHTAGQRVLDATGNLKAVQSLLGHSSIQTTGDIYTDWDIDQLAQTMARVLTEEENE